MTYPTQGWQMLQQVHPPTYPPKFAHMVLQAAVKAGFELQAVNPQSTDTQPCTTVSRHVHIKLFFAGGVLHWHVCGSRPAGQLVG